MIVIIILRFPPPSIFQKSIVVFHSPFILDAMKQRIMVSLRRSFDWLSKQTTHRDGHLGGDISFLCQPVNRRSHQTAESRDRQRGKDPKPQHNQFTINKQFYSFSVKICLSGVILITIICCTYTVCNSLQMWKHIFHTIFHIFSVGLVPNYAAAMHMYILFIHAS